MTAVGQDKGDRVIGNLESVRCDTPGVKGNDGDGREQPENLDIDEH